MSTGYDSQHGRSDVQATRSNVILDGSVLLHDPQAPLTFGTARVLLPIEVIEEIDAFKRDMSEVGRNSRIVAAALDRLRTRGSLGDGVPLDDGGLLRVVCDSHGEIPRDVSRHLGAGVERQILCLALQVQAAYPDEPTVVVSKNVNLRLRADALGIETRDYQVEGSPDPDAYTGWRRLDVPEAVVRGVNAGMEVQLTDLAPVSAPREYALLRAADCEETALARFRDDQGTLGPLHPLPSDGAAGIKPLNIEQSFALDALLDDSVNLVTLSGKAGTGKTLLAVAAGLQKVFAEDRYYRVQVFRPTMPVSSDIGYLPGTVEEKMRPWMQPIYDAVELIREQDRRSRKRILPGDLMECEEIVIEPLTYIRGRSIPHQFIIIDEAQNLTPREIKTIITRVGQGTKIALTGDPHQIDNPYVDSLSNGLVFLVDRFRLNPLAAHVGLVRGERSELAETAANLL